MKLRAILILAAVAAALGAGFVLFRGPEPPPPPPPRQFVWDVEMTDLTRIGIALPREALQYAWVKDENGFWYFDEPDGPKVEQSRWGGGIPLLLSGPGANRQIAEDATDEQIDIFGLAEPRLLMHLTVDGGATIEVEVGDQTPDGQAYYVRLAAAAQVYTVDFTWYNVLARLVYEPPYPQPE